MLTWRTGSKWMWPYGQASRHILQPAHRFGSISTAPVVGLREMAAAGQTASHHPSAQCMHVRGTQALSTG